LNVHVVLWKIVQKYEIVSDFFSPWLGETEKSIAIKNNFDAFALFGLWAKEIIFSFISF